MNAGSVVRLRSYRHYTGAKVGVQTMDFTAPNGAVYLAILLGIEDKDEDGQHLDPEWCLNDLGWFSGKQIQASFGDAGARKLGEDVDRQHEETRGRRT